MQSAQSQISARERAWQAEADLLADGRTTLEKLASSWRYRHLYPDGANVALLLEAYRELDRRRAVGRIPTGDARKARRFLRREIRRRFRKDTLARDQRLLWKYPRARLQRVSAGAPQVVERALARVDRDVRNDVEDLTVHGRHVGAASDQSMIDPRHTQERLERGLRQLRMALINEALADPRSIPALHPQFVALASSVLPTRRRHPIAALIMVKLPLYFWMSLILLFNVVYLAAFVFVNERVMGRIVSTQVSRILQGELEIESIYWRPRLIVDLITGQPTPLVAEGVSVYEPFKGVKDERGRKAAHAERLELTLVLHEIIPWNRLGIPRLFDIPWILHFGEVRGSDPVYLDIRQYRSETSDGDPVTLLGLRDAFQLYDFDTPDDVRGLSVHLDDAKLDALEVTVDDRELSIWSAALGLRDASFGLWFDAPDPREPWPVGIPFRFLVNGRAPRGELTIDDFVFALEDTEVSRFVDGLDGTPDGDVSVVVSTHVDGSPMTIEGSLLSALTYAAPERPATEADINFETPDVGPLAASLVQQLGLTDVTVYGEDQPARARVEGPLGDPTFRVWLEGVGLDALREPAWAMDDVVASMTIRETTVPDPHRTPGVGPEDTRWLFSFDRLSGAALDGEFALAEGATAVAVFPELPLEPWVLAADLNVSALNPAQLVPDDPSLAAMMAGGATGRVNLRRFELIDHEPPPPVAGVEVADEDEDTVRAELELYELRVRRDRGPADDGLPRRLRIDGELVVGHDGAIDSSGLTVAVDGGRVQARGALTPDLSSVTSSSVELDVADGEAFMNAFGLTPYFEAIQARLGASGPIAALSGQGGSLAVTGLGRGKLGRTEVTRANLWMERGTLHLRSPNAQAFGGKGSIELEVHLTDGRHFREDPLVRAKVDLDGVSLAQLAGDEFEGQLDMRVDVDDGNGNAVRMSDLRARAAVYASRITLRGNTFRDVSANLDVDRDRVAIERLTLPFHRSVSPFHAPEVTVPVGQVEVSGTVSLDPDPALALAVTASGVPLGLLSEVLEADIPIRARISAGTELQVGGTLRRPSADGKIALAGIHAASIPLGNGEMRVSSRDRDRQGPLAAHRELRIAGEFSDRGDDVSWTLDAVVALATGKERDVAAQAHLFVDRLSLQRLLNDPDEDALSRLVAGALEGLSADALTCNPGAPMLSDCLSFAGDEQSLQVGLTMQRAWMRDRKGPQDQDPCDDPRALCSRGQLVADVDWPMVTLQQPWRLGAGGLGASTLAVSGTFDLSEPPLPPEKPSCNDLPGGGRSHGEIRGAVELAALQPLFSTAMIEPSGGTLALDLVVDGYALAPALGGRILLPPENDAIRLELMDEIPVQVKDVVVDLNGNEILASAALVAHGQTLQVGDLASARTSYTFGGPCAGAFSVAGSGSISGRIIDALAGDDVSARGSVGVDRVVLGGKAGETLTLDRAEARVRLDASNSLELESDIGLEPIRSRGGRIELQLCTDQNPCPGGRADRSVALFVGGQGAAGRSGAPTHALDLAIGERGRARAWGQVYLLPGLDGVDDTRLTLALDEVTYRTYDGLGRPELEADLSTPELVIEGGSPLYVRGRVDVERSRWLKDALEDVGLLDFLSDEVEAPEAPPPEFLRNLQLAVDLRTSAPLRIDNNIASGVEARFAAKLSGTYDAPEITGRVDVEPGGEVRLPLVSGTFEIQHGKILLQRDLEDAELNLRAQREEPVYVDGQARQFSVVLLGPLDGIRWECDTGAVAQDETTTARACIDYLVFGAGDVQVSDSDVQRTGSGGLLYARKGLEVVSNVAELDVTEQLSTSLPRTDPYLPDIHLRLGQIGPELEVETPRDWFDFDYGRASFGLGYTRGYPGFLLRSNREFAFRLEFLDPFTLEARTSQRSYLNERIIFDPLRQQTFEGAIEFEIPSLR